MAIKQIAFIGTGVMGRSMAGHLIDAGHSLAVYNRTKSKAEDLLAKGAVWKDSPAAAAKGADVAIAIVGYPQDVESVFLGEEGILRGLEKGALAIDMTTSSPLLSQRIAEEGRAKGIQCLDAPVSGGDRGAKAGSLSIMVGGEEAAFEQAKPLFEAMGENIVLQGPAGAGQHTKMSNQIAIASGMIGVAEALVYAKRAGLDPKRVLQSIESGAAGSWSLSNLAPRALDGDFAPGFYVKHFIKDMKVALEAAEEMKLALPGLELARSLYERLAAEGGADEGTQALLRLYFEGRQA